MTMHRWGPPNLLIYFALHQKNTLNSPRPRQKKLVAPPPLPPLLDRGHFCNINNLVSFSSSSSSSSSISSGGGSSSSSSSSGSSSGCGGGSGSLNRQMWQKERLRTRNSCTTKNLYEHNNNNK